MSEIAIDISRQRSKGLEAFAGQRFDFVITTFEETPRLMAAVPPKWKTFAVVPLRTGLRVGELLQTHGDE